MAKLGRPLILISLPLPLDRGMWEEERALWMTRVVELLRSVVDLERSFSAWLGFRPAAAAASAAALFRSILLFSALVATLCSSRSSLSVKKPEPGA